MAITQHKHAYTHDDKRKQRAYGNQFSENVDRKDAGHGYRDASGENRRYIGCLEARMHAGKTGRQQTVTRHCKKIRAAGP